MNERENSHVPAVLRPNLLGQRIWKIIVLSDTPFWPVSNLFQCNEQEDDEEEEKAVIGCWSAFGWLAGMTVIIALLSEYVVGTIEVYIDLITVVLNILICRVFLLKFFSDFISKQ